MALSDLKFLAIEHSNSHWNFFRITVVLFWILSNLCTVHAVLIERIADTTVAVSGDAVQLKCCTSLSTRIYWGYQPPGSQNRLPVYEAGHVTQKLRERYSLSKTLDRCYILIIRNVSFLDGGKYICVENDDLDSTKTPDRQASGELIVIGDQLNCTHNISAISVATDTSGLNLQPDYINIKCSVDYRGNKAPVLMWNQDDAISANSSEIRNPTNIITYSLTVLVNNKMNGTQLSCHIQDVYQHNLTWTSPLINILYLVKTRVTKYVYPPVHETCSVHTNMDCVYTWIHNSSGWSSKSKKLIIDSHNLLYGSFLGSVHCQFRGRECEIINIHELNVEKKNATREKNADNDDANSMKQWTPELLDELRDLSAWKTLMILTLCSIWMFILIAMIFIYMYLKRKKSDASRDTTDPRKTRGVLCTVIEEQQMILKSASESCQTESSSLCLSSVSSQTESLQDNKTEFGSFESSTRPVHTPSKLTTGIQMRGNPALIGLKERKGVTDLLHDYCIESNL